ncbi:hypothetical protein JCM1840_001846 [Sporobolomyces johnsonii]
MSRSRSPSRAVEPALVPILELRRSDYYLGTSLLVLVVLMWVSSSFLMNQMFTDMDYNKPFLVTWICTSTFSLYLIRPAFSYWRARRRGEHDKLDRDGPLSPKNDDARPSLLPETFGDMGDVDLVRPPVSQRRDTSRSLSRARPSRTDMGRHVSIVPVDPPLTTRETAKLALLFCGLWFAANWAMNAALGYTSVSSTTILASMSGFFTLAAGACVGVESFTAGKLISVVLSIVGVAVVSLTDSKLSPPISDPTSPPSSFSHPAYSSPLLGDFLALLSAVAYAAYVLLLKVRIRSEARVSMTLFFGWVGLWNILLLWPMGVLLDWAGVETFELPKGKALWASLLINASITFVSDALYLRAMLLTSPLAVTLGLSLTIPLAMLGDLYRSAPVSLASLVGGALVLGSFVANGVLDLKEAEQETVDKAVAAAEGERERLLEDGGSRRTEEER